MIDDREKISFDYKGIFIRTYFDIAVNCLPLFL